MTCSSVIVEFSIDDKVLDVDYITKKLNILPKKSFVKGEIYQNDNMPKPRIRNFSLWCYSLRSEETYDAEKQIDKILEIIRSKETELLEIHKKYMECNYVLGIVLKIEDGIAPAVVLTPRQSQLLANNNITVSIDIYP
ncbi:DUF4279 domain-containing protein [Enterococcus sp. BWB1-3]|uniref:DUF4279 domain-containing protein n=1 Tax=Enterococcus sp. BWB1-3 TaxID=2787713 RepID=UPI00192511DB|nr:DUF4279 domain-containing protein [Enterococcus sp. BWB1-3]MBL1230365.1 DUF4279 domain-containing protein [Enterococcus sp. BWB1-3]